MTETVLNMLEQYSKITLSMADKQKTSSPYPSYLLPAQSCELQFTLIYIPHTCTHMCTPSHNTCLGLHIPMKIHAVALVGL